MRPEEPVRIDLPSGAWADLLPPDQLRAKHVRIMTRAISQAESQRVGAMVVDFTDGAIAIVVQDWSCTDADGTLLPVPSADWDSLDEMDYRDYHRLLNHGFVTEVTKRVSALNAERDNPDDWDDPDSPSGPSGESRPALGAAPSRAAETGGTAGTRRRPTSGSPSDGAGPRSK